MKFDLPEYEKICNALEKADPLPFVLAPLSAYVIATQLQLALRHPENRGAASDIARDIVRKIQAILGEIDPIIAESLEKGWHPEFDMTVEEYREFTDGQN